MSKATRQFEYFGEFVNDTSHGYIKLMLKNPR